MKEAKTYDVLILGGGFAGFQIAKHLERNTKAKIALVDRNDYFLFAPSLYRLVFNPSCAKKITVLFRHVLKRTEIITDELIRVTPGRAVTSKKELYFRFLVISAGSAYPIFLQSQKNVYGVHSVEPALAVSKALGKAESIAVIGGGLIGVEMAAELATKTKKKITLIDPYPRLLSRNPEKAGAYAKKFLESKRVRVINGERAVSRQKNEIVTDKKTSVKADLVLWCGGTAANTKILGNGLGQSVNERGFIRVNEFFQVKNHPSIFAAGDIAALPEEKTAQNAGNHAMIAARNIRMMLSGKKPSCSYVPSQTPMVISLGDWDGIFCKGNIVIGGIIPGIMKHLIEIMELWKARH